jgi:uncharacterized membrane protein HdeD (DUF308 family)
MAASAASPYRGEKGAAGVLGRTLLLWGTVWVLLSLAIPQLDLNSLRSIAILLGIVLLLSAASQAPMIRAIAMEGAERLRGTHALLAVLFVVGGVVAWVWPDPTATVLARLVAWYLLVRGIHDIVNAFVMHQREYGVGAADARRAAPWWTLLSVGVFEIGIAFWAASDPRQSLTDLHLWIGLAALATGLTMVVMGFRVAGMTEPVDAERPPSGYGARAVTEPARVENEARRSAP